MDEVGSAQAMQRAPQADVEAITAVARGDLLAMRGARIFVTGGTGYIGRWLLESLHHANRILDLQLAITVLSRRPSDFCERYPHLADDSSLTFIKGDVREFICNETGFTHVIHAATDVVASATPLDVFDVTVLGTRRVLEFAAQQGVKDVLLLSSGAVYGPQPAQAQRASESLPCLTDVTTNRSAYGLGKIATEWLGNTYAQQWGFSCKSARVFAQIGPYLELGAHFAAGNFIRDVLRGESIIINGDGTAVRSYMHAVDLVSWLWAILVRGKNGSAYNVGAEHGVSIRALAETVIRVAGVESGIQVLGQPAPGAAPSRYVPDTRLAREELGLSITVPFEEALRRTLDWYRPQIKKTQT